MSKIIPKKQKMETLSSLLSNTRNTDPDTYPNRELLNHRNGETSGGKTFVTVASSTISGSEASTSGKRERKLASMEMPPTDDVCPICFGNFAVPCRAAPCGHWYCGSCILQYWNFSAALQPCKCPMCLQRITKLTPEASLYHTHDTSKVLRNVGDYNRLFVGGISGIMLMFRNINPEYYVIEIAVIGRLSGFVASQKFLAIPLYVKRIFREMLNSDRPGVYLHEMRIIALLLGILFSFAPFDFLRIGRGNIIDLFDYSAFALSFIFYLVGLFLRWKRKRNIRQMVDMPERHD